MINESKIVKNGCNQKNYNHKYLRAIKSKIKHKKMKNENKKIRRGLRSTSEDLIYIYKSTEIVQCFQQDKNQIESNENKNQCRK